MVRESNVLRLSVAILLLVSAQGKRLAFHFNPDGAFCQSGTYNVELKEVKFKCTSGENLCRPGDSVTVKGHCKLLQNRILSILDCSTHRYCLL
jgi:hypothetical protein